jgi:hypothetical protein
MPVKAAVTPPTFSGLKELRLLLVLLLLQVHVCES